VKASVRYLAQPAFDRQIGRLPVDNQTILGQSAGKRNPEAIRYLRESVFAGGVW
jgi:hypothetical protein